MFTLPTHPRTGLQAIGIINGKAVWPVMGAADDPPADPPPADPPPAPPADPPKPTDPPVDPLEDKTDWKAEARKWETRAKENKTAAEKLAEIETANQTELEKAQKAADTATETAKAATARAVKAEIRSLADKFTNRDDAVVHMAHAGDLARFLDDSGDVDTKAIGKALGEFLKDRPDLAVADPPPAKPGGKPVPNLRPGAAPNAPERPASLEDAIAARLAAT